MADIFISYSREDRDIVAPLAAFLEAHGYDVWWDRAIVAGDEFRQEIMRQIAAARRVIVVWTVNSVGSAFVLDEARAASKAKKLLPLRVAELSPDYIPFGYGQFHTEIESDRDALLRALNSVAPSKDAAAGNAPRWMWLSTYESVAAEAPSVWAIVETILAIVVYWSIAMYFGTYAHLLAGVILAPMVLLRSDASVKLGVNWFSRWELGFYEKDQPWKRNTTPQRFYVIAFGTLAALASFCLTFWLVSTQLGETANLYNVLGWVIVGGVGFAGAGVGAGLGAAAGALRRGAPGGARPVVVAVIGGVGGSIAASILASPTLAQMATIAGSAVAAGMVTAIATIKGEGKGPITGAGVGASAVSNDIMLLAVMILIPTVLAGAAAIIVVSLMIRIGATLRYLANGMQSMPRNFRQLVLSTSPLQPPELIPGLFSSDSEFRTDNFLKAVSSGNWAKRMGLALLLMVYLPAWTYRVSIKSTAWFWWPLAYIGREPHEARDPELMRRLVLGSPFRRLGRWIAVLFLLAVIAVNGWDYLVQVAQSNGVKLPALPENSLVVGMRVDLTTGVPWQTAGIASAVLTLLVFWWTSHAAIRLQRANELKDLVALVRAGRPFSWIERLQRVGFLCTLIFWGGLAGHLALSANSQRCWIDPGPALLGWIEKIYGRHAPPPPHCSP